MLQNRPLIYYIGLFGDFCIQIYCFCSGYAQQIMYGKDHKIGRGIKRLPKFLLHFWIGVILFSIIGILCQSEDIPISINDFIGNIFLYRLSYNGAWWFMLTYILLVLAFPIMRLFLEKIRPIALIFLSGMLYVIFYYFENMHSLNISNILLAWLWRQICLLGRTQFPFMIGMIWNKYLVLDKIRSVYNQLKMRKLWLCLILIATFVFHCFVQSLIVAPITGMLVLMCFPI